MWSVLTENSTIEKIQVSDVALKQCDKTLSDITPLASMQVLSALTFRPELVQGYLSAYVYSGGADRGWVGILSQPRL